MTSPLGSMLANRPVIRLGAPPRFRELVLEPLRRLVSCPAKSCDKLRRIVCCRQGAMTCRGGFQTRPCGVLCPEVQS